MCFGSLHKIPVEKKKKNNGITKIHVFFFTCDVIYVAKVTMESDYRPRDCA